MKKLSLQNNELQQKSQEEKTHAADNGIKQDVAAASWGKHRWKKPHTDTNGQAAWMLAVEPFTKPGMKITASGAKAMQMYDFHA